MTERPEIVKEEHLNFFDALRESGQTNMFGATPWLRTAFPEFTDKQCREILMYWMKTFSERHQNDL